MGEEPLSPPVAAELLRAGAAMIHAELSSLPDRARRWHPAAGEWCVQEVLGHLIEAEKRGFAGRVRVFLGSDNPRVEAWDQDAVARDRRDCDRDWAGLWEEFSRLRADSVPLVAGLTAADLARGGHHPKVGFLAVADLLHEWVHHDRNHIRQMLANLQALAWPHMGNAQRFSLPTRS
jgi:hypothetical protein